MVIFKGQNGFAFFGNVSQVTMVPEALDQHGDGPGRVGHGKNGPNGSHVTLSGTSMELLFLYVIYLAIRK